MNIWTMYDGIDAITQDNLGEAANRPAPCHKSPKSQPTHRTENGHAAAKEWDKQGAREKGECNPREGAVKVVWMRLLVPDRGTVNAGVCSPFLIIWWFLGMVEGGGVTHGWLSR